MMIPIYTLNLTHNGIGRINLAPLTFGADPKPIKKIEELKPCNGPLVLYVVGHAVPNGLRIDPGGAILPEAELANQIISIRGDQSTLLIIDACFAQGFQRLAGLDWPDNFGLIFSCMAHERSWHTGPGDPGAQSLFSAEIDRAIGICLKGSFRTLETELTGGLAGIQTPVVATTESFLKKIFESQEGGRN